MPAQQENVRKYGDLSSALEMSPSGPVSVNGRNGRIYGASETILQTGNSTIRVPCRRADLDGLFNNRTFCRVDKMTWIDYTDYVNQNARQPQIVGRPPQQYPQQSQQPARRTPSYGRVGEESRGLYENAQERLKEYAKCKARGGNCDLTGGVVWDAENAKDRLLDYFIDKGAQCVTNPKSCGLKR